MLQQSTQQINEQTLTEAIQQIHDHVSLAEQRVSILRGHFWGEGETAVNRPTPTTLSGMIEDIGTRLASLCGELATINCRVGCTPEPISVSTAGAQFNQPMASGNFTANQNYGSTR